MLTSVSLLWYVRSHFDKDLKLVLRMTGMTRTINSALLHVDWAKERNGSACFPAAMLLPPLRVAMVRSPVLDVVMPKSALLRPDG